MIVNLAASSRSLGPVKTYVFEKFGIQMPLEPESIKAILATPFSEEVRRGRSDMIPGTEEDNAPPVLGAALQSLSEVPENECYTLGVLSQGQCTCQEDL